MSIRSVIDLYFYFLIFFVCFLQKASNIKIASIVSSTLADEQSDAESAVLFVDETKTVSRAEMIVVALLDIYFKGGNGKMLTRLQMPLKNMLEISTCGMICITYKS